MADGVLPSTHRINLRDDGAKGQQYPVALDAGDTVPTNGQSGFAKGAHFIDTNAANDAQWLMNFGTVASCNFDVVQGIRDTAGGADGLMAGTGTALPSGTGTDFGSGALFVRSTAARTAAAELYFNTGGAITATFRSVLAAGNSIPDSTQGGFAKGAEYFDTDAAVHLSHLQNFGGPVTTSFAVVQSLRAQQGDPRGTMMCTGLTAPANAAVGYAGGAVFFQHSLAASADAYIMMNTGGTASAAFKGLIGVGANVPTDGANGYGPGALFLDGNVTTGRTTASLAWFINIGTAVSAEFQQVTLTVAA